MANILIGNEEYTTIKTSQVYKATHDGEGNRLPYLYRSFISFTYGGKAIEDFGLIVVTNGVKETPAYASFSDVTETFDVLDGQLYWGSHFEANKIIMTLATDGITDVQLNEFKKWFEPGKLKELILAEYPNRAIMARVAESPIFSLLPFEKEASLKISNISYKTKTTEYRGEISFSFVMDEPYWYNKLNYMPTYINKETMEEAELNDAHVVNTLEDEDSLKIMLEDGIPYQNVLSGDYFLGGNILVTRESRVGSAQVGNAYVGIITGTSSGLTTSNTPTYLFYSGTAPCKPKIQFQIAPSFSGYYIQIPKNSFVNNDIKSYIRLTNNGVDKYFYFTTPSLLTGYNTAISIFSASEGKSIIEIKTQITNEVKEYYSRAWAIACLNKINSNESYIINNTEASDVDNLKIYMQHFIDINTSFTFSFDSKTGEALGNFRVATLDANHNDVDNSFTYLNVVENVGDMVLSNYLIIDEKNYLNSDGNIVAANCTQITSNDTLSNFLIFFKNMYY